MFIIRSLYAGIIRAVTSWKMRWLVHVEHVGEMRNLHGTLVGKSEGNELLGRSRRRWEDNIKVSIEGIGCGVMDWIQLAQHRVEL
jgi:hypothetical protein